MFCYEWDFFGEAAAAWVQAIGTIAALALAVWLPTRDAKRVARMATIEQIRSLKALSLEITNRIDMAVDFFNKDFEQAGFWVNAFKLGALMQTVEKIRAIDTMTLRDDVLVSFVSRFPDLATSMITEFESMGDTPKDLRRSRFATVRKDHEQVKELQQSLDQLLKKYLG